MRITLSLDEDIHLITRQQATQDGISVGAALSRLARAGLMPKSTPAPLRSRYSVLEAREEVMTDAHVRQLMETNGI